MKYLEDEKLNELTSELTDVSLGDSRIINGRIEAFITKRAGTDKKYALALGERYVAEMELAENQLATFQQFQEHLRPLSRKRSQSAGGILESFRPLKHQRVDEDATKHQAKRPRAASFDSTKSADSAKLLSSSALGDFQEMSTRRLMTDLILTLNASFPDYDFGAVRPKDFKKVPVSEAMRSANDRLSVLASRKTGFLGKMWESIDQVITLQDAHVYTFVPPEQSDELSFLTQTLVEDDSATPLWSFNYFFVNKQMKRILFFCCVETMQHSDQQMDEFITKSVGYSERGNDSNFDLDPAAADVAGGIPVETKM